MALPREKPVRLPKDPLVEFVEIKDHWTAKESKGSSTYTAFRIGVRCAGAEPEIWDVYRRYNDFHTLAKDLKALKCRFPPLPPKNPFGFQDEAFLRVGPPFILLPARPATPTFVFRVALVVA